MRLVLASASPRRRELLEAAGLQFAVTPANVPEEPFAGEPPAAYIERVARAKADTVAAQQPDAVVLAADTEVVIDGIALGKPRDETDAAFMLRRLSGRPHEVWTGVAVAQAGRSAYALERTTVWMRALGAREIDDYVRSGEPMDKAGGYAIQGRAARFIPKVEGSWTNVVGLPVARVLQLLPAGAGIG